MDFTSSQDALAMFRNRTNSLSELRLNPSAMLFETETEARVIWLLKLRSLVSSKCL